MNTLLSIVLILAAGYGLYRFIKARNDKAKEATYTPGKRPSRPDKPDSDILQ